MKALYAALAAISLSACATDRIPQKAQASNLAVPDQTLKAASIMAASTCHQLVGLLVIDTEGGLHPVNLEGLTQKDIDAILAQVPADKVLGMTLPCQKEAIT